MSWHNHYHMLKQPNILSHDLTSRGLLQYKTSFQNRVECHYDVVQYNIILLTHLLWLRHQLPSVLSCHAGWSRGHSPSDRPAVRQHTQELMSTTHTYPWLISIITWCRPFPFVPTNILLKKSKLKLEWRAIAIGFAMSPRNLGGKYRCRPHRRPRTCTRQFFVGTRAC